MCNNILRGITNKQHVWWTQTSKGYFPPILCLVKGCPESKDGADHGHWQWKALEQAYGLQLGKAGPSRCLPLLKTEVGSSSIPCFVLATEQELSWTLICSHHRLEDKGTRLNLTSGKVIPIVFHKWIYLPTYVNLSERGQKEQSGSNFMC